MWPLYVIGGAIIVGKMLFGEWAAEHNAEQQALRLDRRKREQAREEEPLLDLTGARAFWQVQIGEVGNYHIKGMPKGAVFIARLSELTEDHFLVLQDENDDEVARILLWDVDDYSEFEPPEEATS